MASHHSLLLRMRQEMQSATNGINEIGMALIVSEDMSPEHLIAAAEIFERVGRRLRELAVESNASAATS